MGYSKEVEIWNFQALMKDGGRAIGNLGIENPDRMTRYPSPYEHI